VAGLAFRLENRCDLFGEIDRLRGGVRRSEREQQRNSNPTHAGNAIPLTAGCHVVFVNTFVRELRLAFRMSRAIFTWSVDGGSDEV
jgi:hypothetical protein